MSEPYDKTLDPNAVLDDEEIARLDKTVDMQMTVGRRLIATVKDLKKRTTFVSVTPLDKNGEKYADQVSANVAASLRIAELERKLVAALESRGQGRQDERQFWRALLVDVVKAAVKP